MIRRALYLAVPLLAFSVHSHDVARQPPDSLASGPSDTRDPGYGADRVERYYCTQYGPFFLRFHRQDVAGVFAILMNDDIGAVIGRVDGQSFVGRWLEIDNSGDIKIEFSEDWHSMNASYSVDSDPETWRHGWLGRIRPAGKPASFKHDDVAYLCAG